jgi:DNA primase
MAIIPPHLIDEVRLALDIAEVISEQVSLKKQGRNYFGLCPFHNEKTPSFSVNTEKQIFHCFGCGAGGNVFAFVQRREGVSFPEAVRLLAKRARINIPEPEMEDHAVVQRKEALYFASQFAAVFFQEMLFAPAGTPALSYAHERGLDDETLRAFGVGFAPSEWSALANYAKQKQVKLETLVEAGLLNARDDGGFYDRFRNRLMFPIHNPSGRVVAFGGRRLPHSASFKEQAGGAKLSEDDNTPKYINTAETSIYQKGQLLYALPEARNHAREKGFLIVVEGYLDAIRLHMAGLKNTVATAGTALTEDQARLMLRTCPAVTLLYDSDTAGAAATLRGADILVESGLQVAVAALPAGDDPDSFALKHGAAAIQQIVAEAMPLLDFRMQNLASAIGPTASPAQRAEALASLAETVAKIASPDQRSRIVQQVAKRLQLREDVLWSEINRVRAVRRPGNKPPLVLAKAEVQNFALRTPEQVFVERCRETETELIRIMILYPEAIAFVFSFMRVEDFHDEDMREMAAALVGVAERASGFEREELLHSFTDPRHAEFASRVIHQEAPRQGMTRDFQRWAADCMAKLQRLVVQERIRELQELIRDREGSGGDTAELSRQFHEHLDYLQRIRAESFLLVQEEQT